MQPEGSFVELHGEPFYLIAHCDAMEPFFLSVVSASDHYLFASSNGGLTVGRRNRDKALFPYYTDDRVHDSVEHTGCKTILRVRDAGLNAVWEPFSERGTSGRPTHGERERNLYKSVYGNRIVFEEIHHGLGLSFRYEWATSERFGFVRSVQLANLRAQARQVEVLDGLQNLLPAGVTQRFQLEYSTLVDGYKRAELEPRSGMAILQLTSVPQDRAEPSEALSANVVWAVGMQSPCHLLSSTQLEAFRNGESLREETEIHGRRLAYFISTATTLSPHGSSEWAIVADVSLDTAAVKNLLHLLEEESDPGALLKQDIDRGTESLLRIVGAADGLQCTSSQPNTWHHFASTMFNVMRGGIPADQYFVNAEDFRLFVSQINRRVARRHARFLRKLPERLTYDELVESATAKDDPDLERIAREYLPLTFSRRHGDPSRPWNVFEIRLMDERGRPLLNYQGNWRDIFQNWEALSHSYPGFATAMIFKFLDSSTVDGHNPYRISREGSEWEVLEPHDAWSFIGYWGDHQVVYLLRLLEQAKRTAPGELAPLLVRNVFVYANVPYRIRPYSEMLADPRNTILFDQAAHKRALRQAAKMGADGKVLLNAEGNPVRANLAEKLLLLLLTKLTSFVPEAGIWLNTQRPEWNDANNALVGYGASMVTLYALRHYLHFLDELFTESAISEFTISGELAKLLADVLGTLQANEPELGVATTDARRKQLLDALGNAGGSYRKQVYDAAFGNPRCAIGVDQIRALFATALRHVDHSIRSNRRSDGLYHAYNVLEFTANEIRVRRLPLMLEGQVAVLGSGALSAEEASSLLQSLRSSALYRPDQHSYILYPLSRQPSFLGKNNLKPEQLKRSRLLEKMIAGGDHRLVVSDVRGEVHFRAEFQNVTVLRKAVAALKDPALAALAREEEQLICDLYEEVFQHRFFTGRSQTMFKYEGVGCIYWHMVSKLLLAVREVLTEAANSGCKESTLARLRGQYNGIRDGLGPHKTPGEFGAVPMDPYSHTPGFTGAQQPGMTGQVKEDFIARLGEMGLTVRGGEIHFDPRLVTREEFLTADGALHYWDVGGHPQIVQLEAGTLAFTFCQVPVVVHRSGTERIEISDGAETRHVMQGLGLNREVSSRIFQRDGEVTRLDVYFGMA